jgi:wyosine [tRNA(Phe)-imidazoG37] synthetase (radical SAM superfamily)
MFIDPQMINDKCSMKNDKRSSHIFGPVPSRRLGLSLGVDLTPLKTCTYDCLYCQVGRTTRKRIEPAPFFPVEEIVDELGRHLEEVNPDTITVSGSGEPTLHSRIGEIISGVKRISDIKVALLTNGSLLWREDVRKGIGGADLIMPTLSTVFEETFRRVHRPHRDLHLPRILEGLRLLRKEFKGDLSLEVMLLRGLNDTEEEMQALRGVIEEISPERIYLNTVVRPPADSRALPLDRPRMEEIKSLLGPRAEVIAESRHPEGPRECDSPRGAILEMARRRPVRVGDVMKGLSRPREEVETILEGLVREGSLRCGEHQGDLYYFCREESESA